MGIDIGLFLLQDGLVNAAIYVLLASCLILIFSVTRVIYVAQGEFVSLGALTLAAIQEGRMPPSIYLLVCLGGIASVYELIATLRSGAGHRASSYLLFLGWPFAVYSAAALLPLSQIGVAGQIALTILTIMPFGPIIYRIVFQPLAETSVLVLLIAAVATHLVLVGAALIAFGPEGSRTTPLLEASWNVGPLTLSAQTALITGVAISLMVLFAWTFRFSLAGKALRATAINRTGARLVGIRPQSAGNRCFLIAAVIGGLAGVLISPVTTIYYDTGFVIVLKGFVAAIIGGLSSYPLAVVGAVFIGVTEAFAAFWVSAYRDVIVFACIIPVLLLQSLLRRPLGGEE